MHRILRSYYLMVHTIPLIHILLVMFGSQPGPAYLNCNNTTAINDQVANYTLAVPVLGGTLNLNEVDVAIGQIQYQKVDPTILSIGVPSDTIITSPSLYMKVQGQEASSCWGEYQIINTDYQCLIFSMVILTGFGIISYMLKELTIRQLIRLQDHRKVIRALYF